MFNKRKIGWSYLIIAIVSIFFAFYCIAMYWTTLLDEDYHGAFIYFMASIGSSSIGYSVLDLGDKAKKRALREQAISGKLEEK